MCGTSFGSIMFVLLVKITMNPHGIPKMKISPTEELYERNIAEKVPLMLRCLTVWLFFVCVSSITLIKRPKHAGKIRRNQLDIINK